MNNKAFWVVLIGGIISVITLVIAVSDMLPSFIAPIVLAIYGLAILYVSR